MSTEGKSIQIPASLIHLEQDPCRYLLCKPKIMPLRKSALILQQEAMKKAAEAAKGN